MTENTMKPVRTNRFAVRSKLRSTQTVTGLQGRSSPSQKGQQGVVLIVSLIILTSLSILGIGSMNSTILEVKMSNNSQLETRALNLAESTLSLAEQEIQTMTETEGAFDFGGDNDPYYTTEDEVVGHSMDWANLMSNVVDDGNYITEYLGPKTIPGESKKEVSGAGIAGSKVYSFLVSARSETAKSTVRVVQSIYVTLNTP